MPAINPFPNCCGASIVTGFSVNPEAGETFEMEMKDSRWGPMNAPKLDKDGNRVIKRTYGQKFVDDLLKAAPGVYGNVGNKKDHAVFAILSGSQLQTKDGKAWLKYLKQAGFEYVRGWNNTVHTRSPNYLFMLLKHTSDIEKFDPLVPPKEWQEVESEATPTESAEAVP